MISRTRSNCKKGIFACASRVTLIIHPTSKSSNILPGTSANNRSIVTFRGTQIISPQSVRKHHQQTLSNRWINTCRQLQVRLALSAPLLSSCQSSRAGYLYYEKRFFKHSVSINTYSSKKNTVVSIGKIDRKSFEIRILVHTPIEKCTRAKNNCTSELVLDAG